MFTHKNKQSQDLEVDEKIDAEYDDVYYEDEEEVADFLPPPLPPHFMGFPPPPVDPYFTRHPVYPPFTQNAQINRVPPVFFPLPPTIVTEYEEEEGDVEYIEEEKIVYETLPPIRRESEPKKGIDSRKLAKNEMLDRLQLEGKETAIRNANRETLTSAFGLFFKILYTVSILTILVTLCIIFISYYFNNLSEGRSKENISTQSTSDKNANVWALGESRAGRIVRPFYEACGLMSEIAETKDMLIKGSISRENMAQESFYSIKKKGDSIFFKYGSGIEEKAYYLDVLTGKVWHLLKGNISGERVELKPKEAALIKALTEFDEQLFVRAFVQRNRNVALSQLSYGGIANFEGVECSVIEVPETNGIKINYYFDVRTDLLKAMTLICESDNIEIIYDNYNLGDSVYKLPEKSIIYVNGKRYASISFDFVVRNRGALFPQ